MNATENLSYRAACKTATARRPYCGPKHVSRCFERTMLLRWSSWSFLRTKTSWREEHRSVKSILTGHLTSHTAETCLTDEVRYGFLTPFIGIDEPPHLIKRPSREGSSVLLYLVFENTNSLSASVNLKRELEF